MHEQTIARRKSRFKLAPCVSCGKGAGLVIQSENVRFGKVRNVIFSS